MPNEGENTLEAKEKTIKEYLSSLTFKISRGSAAACDSSGKEVISVRAEADDGDAMPDIVLLSFLKDEIIRQKYWSYWISLFVKGESTFDRF
jgi:hypothetical protein